MLMLLKLSQLLVFGVGGGSNWVGKTMKAIKLYLWWNHGVIFPFLWLKSRDFLQKVCTQPQCSVCSVLVLVVIDTTKY